MKTIRLLKLLIDIIFWGMIVFFVLVLMAVALLFLSPESLPLMFQGYSMLFDGEFPWQINIVPFSNLLGLLLFIVSIYYLRKCISPFKEQKFFSDEVIINLRKSGRLFIIIALGTSLIRMISVLTFSTYVNVSIIGGNFGRGQTFVAIISALEKTNFFLLTIGLFLLVFGHIIKDGQRLKTENDLTI